MATLVFFLAMWAFCKALKAICKPSRRPTKTAPKTNPADTLYRNLAALSALQEQRDEIEQAIAWCDDLISTEDNPEKVLRWMTKRSQLKGQLATVQTKISKLTG